MFPNSHALPIQKLSVVKNQLKQAVSQAEKFAKRPDVNAINWADWFAKSLELLDSSSPTIPFHPDMIPNSGFTLEACQVLASAAQSYVFGGMGSWNDLGFQKSEINKEYERVTKELYEAVELSIVMASNSCALAETQTKTPPSVRPIQNNRLFTLNGSFIYLHFINLFFCPPDAIICHLIDQWWCLFRILFTPFKNPHTHH